ncbi:MAG: hypothetical protein M3N13_04855 [Candidatus Eremiobacteraeota bacterium]|nr:hypothetical protein [Candidatus Eremiobacteraeota bacterium]
MQHLTPLNAVTAREPYEYYRRLALERPFAFDREIGSWVATSSDAVEAALSDPLLRVRPREEPIPQAIAGSTLRQTYGRLARMTEGTDHARIKPKVVTALSVFDSARVALISGRCANALALDLPPNDADTLNTYLYDVSGQTLATLLEIENDPCVLQWIASFARAIGPTAGLEDVAAGIVAADRLRFALGIFDDDDIGANALGYLFQTYDATAGLIGNAIVRLIENPDLYEAAKSDPATLARILREAARYDPPIHNTRRFAAQETTVMGEHVGAGDTVLVILAAANHDPRAEQSYTFGFGGHECPGAHIALATAQSGIGAILRSGIDLSQFTLASYRPSVNARVPTFATKASAQ